jgi:hypothetical protein
MKSQSFFLIYLQYLINYIISIACIIYVMARQTSKWLKQMTVHLMLTPSLRKRKNLTFNPIEDRALQFSFLRDVMSLAYSSMTFNIRLYASAHRIY